MTFARQLEDESGSSTHHTGQLSEKIVQYFDKKPVPIIQPRKNEVPDESVACIVGECSTFRLQLKFVKVQCTCQLGDMSCQAATRLNRRFSKLRLMLCSPRIKVR